MRTKQEVEIALLEAQVAEIEAKTANTVAHTELLKAQAAVLSQSLHP